MKKSHGRLHLPARAAGHPASSGRRTGADPHIACSPSPLTRRLGWLIEEHRRTVAGLAHDVERDHRGGDALHDVGERGRRAGQGRGGPVHGLGVFSVQLPHGDRCARSSRRLRKRDLCCSWNPIRPHHARSQPQLARRRRSYQFWRPGFTIGRSRRIRGEFAACGDSARIFSRCDPWLAKMVNHLNRSFRGCAKHGRARRA